jgi:UDP-N-acetylmuramoylalanine--D-glutamate ligase
MQRVFDIESLKVTVVGAARSGLSAARLLKSRNGNVFLTELSPEEKYSEAAAILRDEQIPHEFGGHSDRVFDADLIVVSPGVPSDSPILQKAEKRAMPIISEIELGTVFFQKPAVAITGTNGKTTTTTLTGEMMAAGGRSTMVAGNIGIAFTQAIREQGTDADIAVLEISSFQLDTCVSFRPGTAAITTITPDHLYRYHGDFREYIASKQRIFMNQTKDDFLIYNHDDVIVESAVKMARSTLVPVSSLQRLSFGGWLQDSGLWLNIGDGAEQIVHTEQLQIQGRHNYNNVLMSALAARLNGVALDDITRAALAFRGVEHRLELVCEMNGVSWVNDSKATNVDSVVIALQSFRKPVVLIAGGRDKGTSYEPLFDLVRERVKHMILLGEAADRLQKEFADKTTVVRARDMQEAVNIARAAANPGDIALLSPACASFDMYESYEHRGKVFKECIKAFCGAA